MKRPVTFLAISQLGILLIFPSFNPVLAHPDPPELDKVYIATDASGSWDIATTPDEVGQSATVKLRAGLRLLPIHC